jgi:hypothetical protein
MAMLEFLLAALLDPVQAALVLAVVLAYRGPLPVLVAGAAAAVASETIMALAGADYTWGEMLAPRLVSSLAQAAVLCWLAGLVWQGLVWQGLVWPGRVGSAPRPSDAHSSRPPPWHMRAFVRRRLVRLRER